jgi:hypothetical protein
VSKVCNIYHLFTETEGDSVFCGPETAVVARGEAEGNNGGRGIEIINNTVTVFIISMGRGTHCFPEVSVNKCFVI